MFNADQTEKSKKLSPLTWPSDDLSLVRYWCFNTNLEVKSSYFREACEMSNNFSGSEILHVDVEIIAVKSRVKRQQHTMEKYFDRHIKKGKKTPDDQKLWNSKLIYDDYSMQQSMF